MSVMESAPVTIGSQRTSMSVQGGGAGRLSSLDIVKTGKQPNTSAKRGCTQPLIKYVPPMPSHLTFTEYQERLSQSRLLSETSPKRQHDLQLMLIELREKRMAEKMAETQAKRNLMIEKIKARAQCPKDETTEVNLQTGNLLT